MPKLDENSEQVDTVPEYKPLLRVNLADFNDWLIHGRNSDNGYSPLTLRRYTRSVADFIRYASNEGIRCLDEINPAWVRSYLNQLVKTEHLGDKQPIAMQSRFSPSTRIVIQSSLNLFWHWAMLNELALDNPIERLTRERAIEREKIGRGGRTAIRMPKVLSWEHQKLLKDLAFSNSHELSRIRDYAIIEFLLETGVRCEELCQLSLLSLDLVAGRVRLIGKGNKERLIHLDVSEIHDSMKNWLITRQEIITTTKSASHALFLTRTGKPMTSQGIYQMISGYLIKLKSMIGDEVTGNRQVIPSLGPHLLRHTAASRMLAKGMPVMQAMANLGHADLKTFQIYAHLLPSHHS